DRPVDTRPPRPGLCPPGCTAPRRAFAVLRVSAVSPGPARRTLVDPTPSVGDRDRVPGRARGGRRGRSRGRATPDGRSPEPGAEAPGNVERNPERRDRRKSPPSPRLGVAPDQRDRDADPSSYGGHHRLCPGRDGATAEVAGSSMGVGGHPVLCLFTLSIPG